MKDIKHARLMLDMARKDFNALEGMNNVEIFDDEIFGFHAQQAVEKTIKAWLSLVGVSYPKIHDLEELFALLEQHGEIVSEQFYLLVDLTDFAVQYRYESFEDLSDNLDRNDIIYKVKNLVKHVEEMIKNSQ